jgi:hypothetical protein
MDNVELRHVLDKFLAFGEYEKEVEMVNGKKVKGQKMWKIYDLPFKNMIGILGKFFIGERMF